MIQETGVRQPNTGLKRYSSELSNVETLELIDDSDEIYLRQMRRSSNSGVNEVLEAMDSFGLVNFQREWHSISIDRIGQT